jgi:hypothetical protein
MIEYKDVCIYQHGLSFISVIHCGLDGKQHGRSYCQDCKDRVPPTDKDKLQKMGVIK